jgi:hypothetical protein
MLRRSRLARCSTLMLAVYLACMAFVLSFILFEVLDIDGSDFPVAPGRTMEPVHAVEPSHDIKRSHLMALGLPAVDLYPPTERGIDGSIRAQGTPPAAPPVPASSVVLGYRVTLARSSLPGSPLSA